MNINQGKHSHFPLDYRAMPPQNSYISVAIIVTGILFLGVVLGFAATAIFTAEQMYIIRPLLAVGSVFIVFCYVLWFRIRAHIFGEIGFIYLVFALAYTVLPFLTFLTLDFNFPLGFDNLNFSVLSPQPAELGIHGWRHFLFISGVAAGYIAVRGRTVPLKPLHEKSRCKNWLVILIMMSMSMGCIIVVTSLSTPVTTYFEHYTRFDGLSWTLRRFVYLCMIFKTGSYFVLMSLMFSQYQRYKSLIYIIFPILCIYETVYSFGSRIETLTLLLAFIGFYHFRVNHISIKKGILYLLFLAFLFSAVEIVRSSNNNFEEVKHTLSTGGIRSASEFGAVFYTGFHLYSERAQGNIPPRDWQMFFYEFASLIPFIDHTTYHPQYWYARHYFPNSVVPPQTMGVLIDSAIWGGEFDLLLRSLINGALFALLTRWFLRRREKWWAFTIYIYIYATCIMTLKYSVLYQLIPFTRILLPVLLFTVTLFLFQKSLICIKRASFDTVT